tara:strand:+ start:11169 stop:12068 length:900 start_codon:yes stop_codon:yes gene_type:complete
MINKNILIATSSFNSKHLVQKLKKLNFNIIKNPFGRKLTKQELIKLLKKNKISSVVAGLETYDKEVFDKSSINIISRVGSGTDNIDLNEAKKNKVKIFSTPKAPVDAVAELTIGSIISLFRNTIEMSRNVNEKLWIRKVGFLLNNKNIVLVGYGRIGRKVHQLLRPFKTNVIVVDPKLKKNNKNILSLDKALKMADLISFHVNIDKPIITFKNIKNIKKGALLVNTSRGNIISEKLLIYALQKKIIKSAWLDVFPTEPYYGKLLKKSELVLTPHIGSFTYETRLLMEEEAINNIIKYYS